jgi:hypothetical protein
MDSALYVLNKQEFEMHKRELIEKLAAFSAMTPSRESPKWKGQVCFAEFLIYYLNNLHIPSDERYDFWNIEPYLPQLMVDAFEQLRTGSDEQIIAFRKQYEEETGYEVPNIIDLGASDILHQGSTVQTTLGFMMRDVTGHAWVESQIDTYCNAQKHVLQQTFDKFLRLVYRRGLGDMIEKCPARGMTGEFNGTDLRAYVLAGRIMFTFAKRIDSAKNDARPVCNEHSVSFVAEEGDPLGLSAGLQSVYADFRTALDMIEDVIKCWPQDEAEQRVMLKPDNKVNMGF